MELALVAGDDLLGMLWVARGNDFVALLGENGKDQIANRLFVLHKQNRFRPALRLNLNCRSSGILEAVIHAREIHLEGAALAGLAVNPDVAAALFDDAVNGGKTETGSPATLLGGVKGLKDVRDGIFVHTHTSV